MPQLHAPLHGAHAQLQPFKGWWCCWCCAGAVLLLCLTAVLHQCCNVAGLASWCCRHIHHSLTSLGGQGHHRHEAAGTLQQGGRRKSAPGGPKAFNNEGITSRGLMGTMCHTHNAAEQQQERADTAAANRQK